MFNLHFDTVSNVMEKSKMKYLIAGDFSTDLLKNDTDEETELFLDNMFYHSTLPVITRPTRFSKDSSSVIDNILTNNPYSSAISGILISHISDHLAAFYFSTNLVSEKRPKYIMSDS